MQRLHIKFEREFHYEKIIWVTQLWDVDFGKMQFMVFGFCTSDFFSVLESVRQSVNFHDDAVVVRHVSLPSRPLYTRTRRAKSKIIPKPAEGSRLFN